MRRAILEGIALVSVLAGSACDSSNSPSDNGAAGTIAMGSSGAAGASGAPAAGGSSTSSGASGAAEGGSAGAGGAAGSGGVGGSSGGTAGSNGLDASTESGGNADAGDARAESAADADALAQCQQCAASHASCACTTLDCVKCLFVGPPDSPSCAGVPYATRNPACSCLASLCSSACPPTCQY